MLAAAALRSEDTERTGCDCRCDGTGEFEPIPLAGALGVTSPCSEQELELF